MQRDDAAVTLRSAPISYAGREMSLLLDDHMQQQQQQSGAVSSCCVHPADLSVPPAWQGRSVAGPKLRLVNMSAFVDFTVPAEMFTANTVRRFLFSCLTLTLWRPLLPCGYSRKASGARPGYCNFWHPGTLTLGAERQSARMSKITNDCLTRSGSTGCFIAVPIWQQWASKGEVLSRLPLISVSTVR